jgi:hypothetical protein
MKEKYFPPKKEGKTQQELLEEEKKSLERLEWELEDLIKLFLRSSVKPEEITEKNIPKNIKELKEKIGRIWGGISYWEARQYLIEELVNKKFSKTDYQKQVAKRIIDLLYGEGINTTEKIQKEGKTHQEALEEEKRRLEILKDELEILIKSYVSSFRKPEEITEKNIPKNIKELKEKIGRIWGGISYWEARQYLIEELVNKKFSKTDYQKQVAKRIIDLLYSH